jgi:hypothetical protein
MGIVTMIERIFKSEVGPGPVEYVVLLMILTIVGLAVLQSNPQSEGMPMTQKSIAVGSKG